MEGLERINNQNKKTELHGSAPVPKSVLAMDLHTMLGIVFGLSCTLFPSPILGLFAKGSAAMTAVGGASLRANSITFILFGLYTVYSSLFLALRKGREGLILDAYRQGICFVPAILILPAAFGLDGILCAQAADVLAALAAGLMTVPLGAELRG